MKSADIFLIYYLVATIQCHGAVRASSSYSTAAEVYDAGGASVSSTIYRNLGSVGMANGNSAGFSYAIQAGYVAQVSGLPEPEIAVEQPTGNSIPYGGSREFGVALIGTPVVLNFTIRNTGSETLGVSAVSITGSHAMDFSEAFPDGTDIPAGGSVGMTVHFTPTASGIRSATLSITSNDADENPFTIDLTGTGVTDQELLDNAMAAAGLTGPNAQASATPFGDGVSNLLKYAFNMNLSAPDRRTLVPGTGTVGLPVMRIVSGTVRYEFLRRKNSGLTYTPQQSSNLSAAGWQPATGTTTVTSNDENWERVEIQQAAGTARFFRVTVSMP